MFQLNEKYKLFEQYKKNNRKLHKDERKEILALTAKQQQLSDELDKLPSFMDITSHKELDVPRSKRQRKEKHPPSQSKQCKRKA